MFRQAVFFCHYRRFIVLNSCRVCVCVEKRERVRGGRAVMEHLISCSLWEPLRLRDARGSCDIESVLITKTGIKGD